LVTVPRTTAARVARAVERMKKRQKVCGRKYLRRDRPGMKILFSPGTNPGFPTVSLHTRSRVRSRLAGTAFSSPAPQSPTGNPGEYNTSNRRRARFERAGFRSRMVTPGRLELPTNSLGNCCSIHLSYGALVLIHLLPLQFRAFSQERFGRLFYSHPSRPASGFHTFQPDAADR
jgi:hypothetical protein